MNRLKDQLIKLGSDNPELQDHLRPILDHLTGKTAAPQRLISLTKQEWHDRAEFQDFESLGVGQTGKKFVPKKIDEGVPFLFDQKTGIIYRARDVGGFGGGSPVKRGPIDDSYISMIGPTDFRDISQGSR